MKRIAQSPAIIKARGVAGAFYVAFGIIIAFEILHRTGPTLNALPGVALGAAMFALGILRVRAALAVGKTPPK